MADIKIIKTKFSNTNEEQELGSKSFDTEDFVYLESLEDVKNLSDEARLRSATDFAIANNCSTSSSYKAYNGKNGANTWLRSACSKYSIELVDKGGSLYGYSANRTCVGSCPCLALNLKSFISARSASRDFKISTISSAGKERYRTIEIPEFQYPQSRVDSKTNRTLETLYEQGRLKKTGKTFTSSCIIDESDDGLPQVEEYGYNGKFYVRVKAVHHSNSSEYSDGSEFKENEEFWIKVEPIKWIIKNWDEMPTSINPKGNGRAKTIELRSEEAIICMQMNENYGSTELTMWQNSKLRAFLNEYDIHEEIKRNGNGNKNYICEQNYSYKGKGFLSEMDHSAFIQLEISATQDEELSIDNSLRRKSRLEKLNPDKTPIAFRRRMTDTEMIKSWIDAGQSVLLRGPSGIGKTERIKKLYPDLIYMKLTNNMFPEKVVGSMNLQTGQSIPPDFAKQALMACATDDERKLIQENIQNLYDLADTIYERSKTAKGKVVIMLDELLNVKPAVQSLVYTLVLNKLVETGKGLKLPANTVVVATGNQKKYSNVAEDLAEPLEKRFDHILDMEPKVGEWIYEFAIPSKIHPSVIGYIFSKYQENRRSEEIEDMGYFYEEPEVGENHLDRNGCRGRTNDPRGWESISRTLYAFEEDLKNGKFVGKDVEALLKASIGSKLREEWAEEFFDFYNHPTLTVEEIVEKRYTQADLPTDINEKFATMAGLLNATPEQVGVCREFIRKHCDPEYLSVYDIYWAGNDEKRMEKIAELREISAMQLEDEGGLIR